MPALAPDVLRRLRLVFAWLVLFALSPVLAHEGHDHGTPTPAPSAQSSARVVLQSEVYELVGILGSDGLRIYLDRFDTNEPVTGAEISVTVGGDEDVAASPMGDGLFTVTSEKFSGEGPLELVFVITAQTGDDLLIGTLDLPAKDVASADLNPSPGLLVGLRGGSQIVVAGIAIEQPYLIAGSALFLGFLLGIAVRSRNRIVPAAAVVLVALVVSTAFAFGHEGHDHGGPAPTPSGDAPGRLSDGSVFLPKPTQRLLAVRTVIAKPQEARKAVSLIGRIIADPNRSGLVQSINGGRILPPEAGLPRLGQSVKRGDVIGLVEQAVSQADQTGISEQIGAIEQEIAVAETKLDRARTLAERNVAPQSQVTDAETEITGLRRRLEMFRRSRLEPETLLAPVDGVIAAVNVVAGQVVGPEDTVFQIIDPDGLWVEALVYGQIDPAQLSGASAFAVDGAALELRFEGFSKALQQQATRVQFAIVNPPPNLAVGQPVQVLAQNGSAVTAIVLPRDAVVRNGNGESIVWRHAEAERFEARPVHTEPFDATRLIVQAGIQEGDRIVVRGSELINQVR
jgi:cobalt-zinc-cadmium efflux system membrane fusion protein